LSEAELIAAAQAGRQDAFTEIVERHSGTVYNLALRLMNDPQEAEDVLQETFISAFRALDRFQGRSRLSTWLYRIAVNTARNTIASRQRRPLDYEAELSESEQNNVAARLKHDDTPEASVLSEEIRVTVNRAIEQLPEDLRTAIVLREVEGLSYEEIAEAMDCPVGTVRSRIFRAREAIDRALQPLLD